MGGEVGDAASRPVRIGSAAYAVDVGIPAHRVVQQPSWTTRTGATEGKAPSGR